MQEQPTSFGQRARRAFRRLVFTILFLGLAAAVLYLLTERNARTYTLDTQSDSLVVQKGDWLPWGSHPYRPSDATLAEAYAPIPLHGASPGDLSGRKFTDRDELDRALFSLLERLARPNIDSEEPALLQRGMTYIRRADALSGLSGEQREALKKLKEEISYYLARSHLDDARSLIEQGLNELRAASSSRSRHARSASQMLLEVEPAAKALSEALRRAVHALSEPGAHPPEEAAKPSTPQ